MPNITFPNQRMVKIHRESAKTDFLGIKNENWQAASRDLGAHALQLYLYLASNANNYTTALSPVAVRQAIGMARSTYHDQFHKLVDKGYLVPGTGNTFDFYEVSQTATQARSLSGAGGHDSTGSGAQGSPDGHSVLPEDIEINNNPDTTNGINNNIHIPKEIEITIPRPKAEGKNRPDPIQEPKEQVFIF